MKKTTNLCNEKCGTALRSAECGATLRSAECGMRNAERLHSTALRSQGIILVFFIFTCVKPLIDFGF